MNRSEYVEILVTAYKGELYGEAWFKDLIDHSQSQEIVQKFSAMVRLETKTKEKLLPLISRLGVTGIDEDEQRIKGRRLAQESIKLSWPAFIEWFKTEVIPFVELYDRLESIAPPEDRDVVVFLAQHERALLEFARRESAGESNTSLDPVLALLNER